MSSAPPGPLERYIRILEALAAFPSGLTAIELEQKLNLPKTTLNRLLQGLLMSDLISSEGRRDKRFLMGSRLLNVLRGDGAWVEVATQRILHELTAETGETSFIARQAGGQLQTVAKAAPSSSVAVFLVPGYDLPLHATASGKLILAYNPAIKLKDELTRSTDKTIVESDKLAQALDEIRKRGYATEDGEHVEGFSTIAVPIAPNAQQGVEYVLGLTGPSKRILHKGKPLHLDALTSIVPRLVAVLF